MGKGSAAVMVAIAGGGDDVRGGGDDVRENNDDDVRESGDVRERERE
jgi:hypothetical protein